MATTDAKAALDEGLKLVVPGKDTAAGAGWDWVARGWGLFAAAPLMWIVAIIVLFVIALVMAFIPILGSLVFQLLQAVFAGGFVAACRAIERGGEFELEHLFAGFSARFAPLFVVGIIFAAATFALMLVIFGFVGLSVLGAIVAGDADAAAAAIMASAISILLGTLVFFAALLPLLAAYWFAPALAMIHDMPPVAAMKAGFFACVRNFVPFLVYGVVMLVAFIVALVPFGLGLLVWFPVAISSTYVAYRQIFTEDAAAAPAPPAMV